MYRRLQIFKNTGKDLSTFVYEGHKCICKNEKEKKEIYSKDIGMEFGIEKSVILIKNEKRESARPQHY